MAKTAKTQTAAAESAQPTLHDCECSRYEIEQWTGEVPEGADPGDFLELLGTGCVQQTARTFAPGHDAKLKALLIRAGHEGSGVRRNDGGMASVSDAMHWAEFHGFAHMVKAGMNRAARKYADREARKIAREAERAHAKEVSRGTKRAAKAGVKADPELVTIKVGRWTYAAAINEFTNEATFTSANGQIKTTKKYTIVTK
jgi:hypothetical protein